MLHRALGVNVVAVVRAVASERRQWPLDLLEQSADLRAVVSILVGQHRRDDPTRVGVGGKVQLAPATTPLAPMLLDQPLAGTAKLQPRAVHQQVHGLAARFWPQHLQRLGPTAQGGVVRHSEIEAEQLQNGADQALGLA